MGLDYRGRTERGKVVWRCATRVEKGKEACSHSSTLNEEWIQDALSEAVCQNGVYDGGIPGEDQSVMVCHLKK